MIKIRKREVGWRDCEWRECANRSLPASPWENLYWTMITQMKEMNKSGSRVTLDLPQRDRGKILVTITIHHRRWTGSTSVLRFSFSSELCTKRPSSLHFRTCLLAVAGIVIAATFLTIFITWNKHVERSSNHLRSSKTVESKWNPTSKRRPKHWWSAGNGHKITRFAHTK